MPSSWMILQPCPGWMTLLLPWHWHEGGHLGIKIHLIHARQVHSQEKDWGYTGKNGSAWSWGRPGQDQMEEKKQE